MGFFESLFYTLWRGFAIGILISAPMGPVGILCIQRTLYKGRKTGLYTGVGAAISDLFYCILTGFGLSFIEEFLERNQNIIQLAGSAVLIAFAIYLFKKNPASSLKTPEQEAAQISPHKNILGGFLFTFSNPLILFLIIGLFARFNFSIPEISFYYYIAGYIAIFCGAIIWWEFVTFSVNKLRAHFNVRSMWLINKIIGVIILIFAIVGIVTGITNIASAETLYWNNGRGYYTFNYGGPQGIIIENSSDTLKYDYYSLGKDAESVILKFRSKNLTGNPGKRYQYINHSGDIISVKNPHWGFFITGKRDTIAVTLKGGEKINASESIPSLELSFYNLTAQEKESVSLVEKVNPYEGPNLWTIIIKEKTIKILTGNKDQHLVFESHYEGYVTGFGFFSGWGNKLAVTDISAEYHYPEEKNRIEFTDSIEKEIESDEDPLTGYWMIFDRELEESLLKLGGNYTLACIKEGNKYLFYYIEGAGVNSQSWKKGEIKAVLSPSPFKDIYEVEWIDAMKNTMANVIRAQKGEGNTLLIQFPYQSSKLRLRKLNP